MTAVADALPGAAGGGRRADDPMVPRPFRLLWNRQDTRDTCTLALEPVDGVPFRFSPGQFTMLGIAGVGEVPISISGDPDTGGQIEHTVRDVGGVTHALVHAAPGAVLGVRGPFGNGWDALDGAGGDLVVVAGGIGLAPLRPALLQALSHRDRFSRIVLLYGTRSPDDVVFSGQLRDWAERGVQVDVIVDYGPPSWTGRVGLVTQLVPRAGFDPHRSLALVCGPELMMRYAATALIDRGVPAERVRVSLERNMKCGVGLCGHCQLRELFVCTDGAVFPFPRVADLLTVREV